MKSINFELTEPVLFSKAGDVIEATHIELKEPNAKVSMSCLTIEGLIQSAMLKMADAFDDKMIQEAGEQKSKKDTGIDADGVMAIMLGGDCNMAKMTLSFRDLFKTCAYIASEKPMTETMLDDMSHRDFKNMIGVYAANFILA